MGGRHIPLGQSFTLLHSASDGAICATCAVRSTLSLNSELQALPYGFICSVVRPICSLLLLLFLPFGNCMRCIKYKRANSQTDRRTDGAVKVVAN